MKSEIFFEFTKETTKTIYTGDWVQYANWLENKLIEARNEVKNLTMHSVSHRRELLLDFLDNIGRYDYETKPFEQIVDEYLKSNNCG